MGEVIHTDSATWNRMKDFSGAPEGGDAEVPTWRPRGCGLLLLYNYDNVGRLPAEFFGTVCQSFKLVLRFEKTKYLAD